MATLAFSRCRSDWVRLMTTIRQSIGSRLAGWRQEEGLTHVEVAARLNLASGKSKWSRGTINEAERGKRAWVIDDLLALALAMGCTVADLLAVDVTVKVGGARHDARGGPPTHGLTCPA